MKLGIIKNITIPEIVLLLFFIIYILFPIATPEWMKPLVRSPVGMLLLFAITVSLFIYTNPALGVVYVFVAYEMLRRSMVAVNFYNTPDTKLQWNTSRNNVEVDRELAQMSLVDTVPFDDIPHDTHAPEAPHSFTHRSLEEEIVDMRAPVGKSQPLEMSSSSFVPVASSLKNASLV